MNTLMELAHLNPVGQNIEQPNGSTYLNKFLYPSFAQINLSNTASFSPCLQNRPSLPVFFGEQNSNLSNQNLFNIAQNLTSNLTNTLSHFVSNNKTSSYDCLLSSKCTDIARSSLHARELTAGKILANMKNFWRIPLLEGSPEWSKIQEFLRLREDDSKEKFLFLSSHFTGNEPKDGQFNPSHLSDLMMFYSRKYDFKFAVIKSLDQICTQIKSAAKTGKLVHVLINAHGTPLHMLLSKPFVGNNIIYQQAFQDCFDGLDPNGRITLISCSTGKKIQAINIAQRMADLTKRVVVAPNRDIKPLFITVLKQAKANDILYYPNSEIVHFMSCAFLANPLNAPLFTFTKMCPNIPEINSNVFMPFHPKYKHCTTPPEESKMHLQEIRATRMINSRLASSFLLHKKDHSTSSYSTLCHDNLKSKFLVLSANHLETNWLGNNISTLQFPKQVLENLAINFDLKYKVISSITEICSEVNEAAKIGEIAGLIIIGKKIDNTSEPVLKISDGNILDENNTHEFSCLSKVSKNGTIVFLPNTLSSSPTENYASKIAQLIGRKVQAPICPIEMNLLDLESTTPFKIYHPPYSFLNNYLKNCSVNNESLMGEF